LPAKQSAHPLRFQDINLSFARRLAAAMTEGHKKYEATEITKGQPAYWKNYKEADQAFALGRVSNLLHHALQLYDTYVSELTATPRVASAEDHLGHAAANLNMLAEFERMGVLPNTEPDKLLTTEQRPQMCKFCNWYNEVDQICCYKCGRIDWQS
jgi:hypothetical protein